MLIHNHNDLHEAFERTTKFPSVSCKRVGKYSVHWPRPISVKFINNRDKQLLFESKRKLQKRIYIVEEYPKEVQNILQLMLSLASKPPEYKGKCQLENNPLIIQGKHYNIEHIPQLPENLLPTKATQLHDDTNNRIFWSTLSVQ